MGNNTTKRIIQVIFILIVESIILFTAAWTINWPWAWIVLGVYILLLLINFFVVPAEVIEERGRKKENVKPWDKVINSINIVPTLLLYVACGLDYRFGWSGNFPFPFMVTGLLFLCAGSLLFTWSMVSNKFFSTMVRLQKDRDHSVASGGPYRVIRHPGYVGYIFMATALPVALGTLWGLVFVGMTVVLLIIRTSLEDKTLRQELKGYKEYAAKVRYRLIPFLW
ncbi:MAG: isoprenylcysteine carboxylmethyltransferase family protein [Spirochaetales bacterium]|nr:isoprenylcysteine carboxylmethyltransferase family protein [Spirochaetales bacterium]